MNVFETVKAFVTPRQAAERYGLTANRNGMSCCPFHEDRHPSMKLNEDYYFCFGCGATGDVVDLTAHLCNLSLHDAAKLLAADFGIAGDPASPVPKVKHPQIHPFREDEMLCFRVLTDYLHLLEKWKVQYAPEAPGDDLDDRFVEACQMIDRIEYLLDILTVADFKERVSVVDKLMKDNKIALLERYTKQKRKEEKRCANEPEIA